MSRPCSSCGAPIVWCRTPAGKRMPVDAVPTPGGNVRVVDGVATVVPAGTGDRTSHFATCPNAGQHRR